MGAKARYTCLLALGAWACGGDDDPTGPLTDDVTPEQGVAMCTPEGASGSWSFARLGAGTKPAVGLGTDGTAHVAFMEEAIQGWVRYARLPAGAASPSELASMANGYFYGPIETVVGPDGEPRVLYHDHDRADQVLATRVGGAWQLDAMPGGGHDGWYNAAVFDQSGVLHTATYDPRGFGGRGVNYGAWDGADWTIELAAAGSFDYAGRVSIVDAGSGIVAAFFDDLAGEGRITARNGPDDWTVTPLEPVGSFVEVGRFPDLEYDPATGELHVVYLALSGAGAATVRHARGAPGAFDVQDVAEVSDFTIGFSGARDLATLALDAQGRPVVALQTRGTLEVLRMDGASVESLGSFGAAPDVIFGQQTEVAIDPQGRIHVVWWQTGETPGTVCHGLGT